jgi:hypothetical protein
MIQEFEKNILIKINFADKFLSKKNKFIENGKETPIFKKKEIIQIFGELEKPCKYIAGGAYVINKEFENYNFELSFVMVKNSPQMYLYVYRDNKLIENGGISNFSYILNFLEYNQNLINRNFGLNSLEDLKIYIMDMIDIFDDFVAEYIIQLKL